MFCLRSGAVKFGRVCILHVMFCFADTTFLEAGETSNVLEELLNTRKKKPVKQVNFWMSKVHCNCYLKFIKILTRYVSLAVDN
jgi:hypothetical protein